MRQFSYYDFMEDIVDFHEKYGLTYNGPITQLPSDLESFRIKFMQEELNEYIKACHENNIEGQADALVDLVYVALGTAYLQGIPFAKCWDEVHLANMRKVKAGPNGEGSKRKSPHDVVKPDGWAGPTYSRILEEAAKGYNN